MAEPLRGSLAKYQPIGKPLGEGGYAETVKAEVVEILDTARWDARGGVCVGKHVVIKKPKAIHARGIIKNRDFIRDVNDQIETDFAALLKLRDVDCVARIFDHGEVDLQIDPDDENEIVFARFLVEEFVEGETLDKCLVGKFGNGGDFAGIADAKDFYDLALDLAIQLQKIHQHQIIHGDIWYTNIMRRPDGRLVFIDFGSAVFRDSTFLRPGRRPADIHGFCAPERWDGDREGRRSDIYSLGGVFFYMATGEKPCEPVLNDDRLKRQTTERILDRNPRLLEGDMGLGVPDLIARCMRSNKEARIRDANALIFEIRSMSFDLARSARELDQEKVASSMSVCVDGLCGDRDEFFCGMFQLNLSILLSRVADMSSGVFDLSGGHEDIVSAMSMYLSILQPGDAFFTQSFPMFWFPGNLGINGRFLTMNRMIARRGVSVRHLFLLCDEDELDKTVCAILATHLGVMRDFRGTETQKIRPELQKRDFRAFYRLVSSKEREDLRRRGWQRCLVLKKDKATVIEPVYDEKGVLRTLRFLGGGGAAVECRNDLERELASFRPLPVAWDSDNS